jgi:hypothetical protein
MTTRLYIYLATTFLTIGLINSCTPAQNGSEIWKDPQDYKSERKSDDSNQTYLNVTSSKKDLAYYGLTDTFYFYDDNGVRISICLPSSCQEYKPQYGDTRLNLTSQMWYVDGKMYTLQINRLETTNSLKLGNNSRKAIEFFNQGFDKEDLSTLNNFFPPYYKEIQVVSARSDLIFDDKHFIQIIASYLDEYIESVTNDSRDRIIQIGYSTVVNGRWYYINTGYYGSDKAVGGIIDYVSTISNSTTIKKLD